MLAVLLTVAARAAPTDDPTDLVREWAVRALAVDQIQGAPQGRAWDARRWADRAPSLGDDPLWDALADEVAPERDGGPVVVARPLVGFAVGDLVPVHAQGHVEPGLVSPRIAVDGWAAAGVFEARVLAAAGLDVVPGLEPSFLPEWRIGARSDGAFLALSQESRWFGPAREGALLYGDGARALPAVTGGLDGRLPGRLDGAGRFSLQALVGVIPGERRDVQRPGWLIVDARWQPVPWIELGATRNAIFGGRENGGPRPVNVLQLLLPTDPHVEGDPGRAEADTDERIALDARVTVPLGVWGLPLDYVEAYVQHAGEDVIARRAGPVPVPSIAGTANLYGGEIAVAGVRLGVEASVIEDDLYRWYIGHRVYHDGWTVAGRSLGHSWGGDARTTTIRLGRVAAGLVVQASYTHVRRVEVADLVEDTLFVFPAAEMHDRVGLLAARPGERGGSVAVTVEADRVRDEAFVPDADHVGFRLGIAWRAGWYAARPKPE